MRARLNAGASKQDAPFLDVVLLHLGADFVIDHLHVDLLVCGRDAREQGGGGGGGGVMGGGGG